MVLPAEDGSIAQMDERIVELTRENAEHEAAIKRAQIELKKFNSVMSIEDALELIAKVICLNLVTLNYYIVSRKRNVLFQTDEQNDAMLKKIKDIDANGVVVTATDFNVEREKQEKSTRELRKRKRICLDILDNILEGGYPKPKKALYDEIGIEI